MERFIQQRLSDRRFNDRPVDMGSRPVAWFEQPSRLSVKRSNASMAAESKDSEVKPKKEKKAKKERKEGEATSDGTDICWSDDYERRPGTKRGEKGSCRRKDEKKSDSK